MVNFERNENTAKRGNPSYVWRSGQERRLQMVRDQVPLESARIIDIGCGVGVYLRAFLSYSSQVYGTEIEIERARQSLQVVHNIALAASEKLPWQNNAFDIAFLHEVIEHVQDDQQTIREAYRVVHDGGHIIIFTPNRWFPFETHGFYWRSRYIFGNIPLINYLPHRIRNKLAFHVKVYSTNDLKKLFNGLSIEYITFTQVFPGFDKLEARFGPLGRIVRKVLYFLEKTPLKIFGISHFVIVKVSKSEPQKSY